MNHSQQLIYGYTGMKKVVYYMLKHYAKLEKFININVLKIGPVVSEISQQ